MAAIISIISISLDMLTTVYDVNRFGIRVEANPSSRFLITTTGFIGWIAINLGLAVLAVLALYVLYRIKWQYSPPLAVLVTLSVISLKMVPGISNVLVALGQPGLLG